MAKRTTETGFTALTFTVAKEGRHFVSGCLELGTASFGDSFDEALANIEEATLEYLNTIERLGERGRVFKEKGVVVTKRRPTTIRRTDVELHPNAFIGPYVTRVPVPA